MLQIWGTGNEGEAEPVGLYSRVSPPCSSGVLYYCMEEKSSAEGLSDGCRRVRDTALPSYSQPVNFQDILLLRDENKRGINSYTVRKQLAS